MASRATIFPMRGANTSRGSPGAAFMTTAAPATSPSPPTAASPSSVPFPTGRAFTRSWSGCADQMRRRRSRRARCRSVSMAAVVSTPWRDCAENLHAEGCEEIDLSDIGCNPSPRPSPGGRGRAVSVTCQCIFFVEWEIHVQVTPLDRPLPPGEGRGEGLPATSASPISSHPLRLCSASTLFLLLVLDLRRRDGLGLVFLAVLILLVLLILLVGLDGADAALGHLA